jgi:hypothetical protein
MNTVLIRSRRGMAIASFGRAAPKPHRPAVCDIPGAMVHTYSVRLINNVWFLLCNTLSVEYPSHLGSTRLLVVHLDVMDPATHAVQEFPPTSAPETLQCQVRRIRHKLCSPEGNRSGSRAESHHSLYAR